MAQDTGLSRFQPNCDMRGANSLLFSDDSTFADSYPVDDLGNAPTWNPVHDEFPHQEGRDGE